MDDYSADAAAAVVSTGSRLGEKAKIAPRKVVYFSGRLRHRPPTTTAFSSGQFIDQRFGLF
jgi:hypothetical protein